MPRNPKERTLLRNGQFQSGGGRASQLQRQPSDIQNLGCPKFEVKDNLSFVDHYSLWFNDIFCVKPHKAEKKTDFLVKIIDLYTKIPNLKSK